MDKKAARQRRGLRTRMRIRKLGVHRLCIHRTPRHIYAQVTAADGSEVLAAASTVQGDLAKGLKATGNVEAAAAVVGTSLKVQKGHRTLTPRCRMSF